MAVTLRYFTEFRKPLFRHITASICDGIYAQVYNCFVLLVRCRRKESSRSLSHLLMSFLFCIRNYVGIFCYFLSFIMARQLTVIQVLKNELDRLVRTRK